MPVLYRGTVGEDKRKVNAIHGQIEEACPTITFEYGDYGLKLIGYRRDAEGHTIISSIRTICQPARPDNGQPEIIADVDALIKEWSA